MTSSSTTADLVGRTHPIARVSRSAVERNLSGHPREVFVDLRHDGWGLGAELLESVAREKGLAGAMTDDGPVAFTGEVPESFAVITPGLTAGTLSGAVPALTLVGRVLGVKPLLTGEGVSYGYVHRASTDTRVALVTGGYAQGILRSLGSQLSVLVAGEPRPIVGRVAMDVCVVDIGDLDVAIGDEVAYLGDPERGEPAIQEWVALTGLSPEELLVSIGRRARREVVA
ncbi:alanine racemase [Microbacterium gorillae]|uniref:alanine racemase n=1 Tax=Microbacterium gorillae TaxID=1231063 RepID=UPI00058D30B8|nr:alanine racemase C-terminal domain-containing protein [Microbacterium gorillae]